MRTLRQLLMILLVPLVTATALAQDAATAQKLFEEGKKLLDEGNHAKACPKLKASLEADPSGGAALNLGRCYEQSGRPASAWASYEQAVVLFRAKGEADRETFARERAAALEPSLSTLTIETADTPGLVVRRDGAKLASGALGTALPLDPGEHTIAASAPGYQSWSKTVTIAPGGDPQTVSIPALQKQADESPPPTVTQPEPNDAAGGVNGLVITGGVLIGVGGVAAIIGAVIGGSVLSGASDAENDPALCDDMTCTLAGREEIDSLEGKAMVSSILIGAGAAVAVGGAVLVIIGASDDDGGDDMALLPSASPDGAALHVVGSF